MIINLNYLKIKKVNKNIDKICKYFDCDYKDLYYIEGIKNNIFDIEEILIEDGYFTYCKNKSMYLFTIFKPYNAIIVDKKFIHDLKLKKLLLEIKEEL